MIRVSIEVRDLIEDEKIIPREPLNDCIKRGILENRRFKALLDSIETRERLRIDLEGNTLNPRVPGTKNTDFAAREIWEKFHPGEILKTEDIIHHVNGNHNDDRPENLLKVDSAGHGKAHAELNRIRKEQPKLS